MSFDSVVKQYEHHPESSLYLGLANFFADEAVKNITQMPRRATRLLALEEIQNELACALHHFGRDRNRYTPEQKKGFLENKIRVDEKLENLRKKHFKMLVKESEIV